MSLSKEVSIDKIEIVERGIIQVRQITKIIEDGKQISASYHRWSLTPGQDVSDQTEKVRAIAQAVWSDEVVEQYQAYVAEQEALRTQASE